MHHMFSEWDGISANCKTLNLYYVNEDFVVMENPFDGKIRLVFRKEGKPSEEKINEVLKKVDMVVKGEEEIRHDGLWCIEVVQSKASSDSVG